MKLLDRDRWGVGIEKETGRLPCLAQDMSDLLTKQKTLLQTFAVGVWVPEFKIPVC